MFILLGLIFPRVFIAYLFLFTGWFVGVFDSWLWTLLGFVLMPYTLLWYTAVAHWYGGTWGTLQIVILIIAVIADLSSTRNAY